MHPVDLRPHPLVTDRGTEDTPIPAVLDESNAGNNLDSLFEPAATEQLSRRSIVPIVSAVVMVVLGLLFTFFWEPVVHHSSTWIDQTDLWGIFRAAHYVAWGDLGGVYNRETGVVAFPGMAVLLAPVAFLSDCLHLTSTIGVWTLPHPTADLVLMPVVMALGSSVLFGADALAEEIGVSRRKRWILCVLVAVLAWPITALWGHPEDVVAMTFALYAMVGVLRGNWSRAGWLLGVGIVFQPLVLLIAPVFIAASPQGGRILFAVRCSVVSAFLVAVAFLGNPSGAFRALVQQPTPPTVNHVTPWVALAPRVRVPSGGMVTGAVEFVHRAGAFRAVYVAAGTTPQEVAGGPGRSIYLLLALLAGVYVWRRPQTPDRLLWLAALVLAGRCFFEAVMTPYYVAPPLILLLVLAAKCSRPRFLVAGAIALAASRFAYCTFGPWMWWTPLTLALLVILMLTYPTSASYPSGGRSSTEVPWDGGSMTDDALVSQPM